MAKRKLAGVTVRMYCQGLGDCFLLTFPPKTGAKPVRVLIDCGVLQKTPAERAKMRAVVENLKADTGGAIDLLVVTHEHWDHVAGFSHAADLFEGFTFGRVWLSWAENLDDPASKTVQADLGKKKKALQKALAVARFRLTQRLAANPDDGDARKLGDDLTAAENVLRFLRLADEHPAAANPATPTKRMTLGDTMNWLRAQVRPGDFRMPGEVLPLPRADGVSVYVLGPPRDLARIKKMDPRGDEGFRHLADELSLLGAVETLGSDKDIAASPFAGRYRVSQADAAEDPFFREFYGFPDDPLGDTDSGWRRIDDDWLVGGVSRLALQLDRGVNNTSLALAFELPDGSTMIFPGDAQIGNWLSWDDVEFRDTAGKKLPTTAADLLRRAVFYKVGHHGSHNATRKAGGLDAMVSGDLVAMIPTDEEFGLAQKPHRWEMPYPDLAESLGKLTYGRVLRADRDHAALKVAAEEGRKASATRWAEFLPRVKFPTKKMVGDDGKTGTRPLYVEYTIPLE